MFCAPFSALRVGLEPELALYWPSHHPASQPTESPDLATLTGIRDTATKADVENHFNTHGTGEITEIKLMNGFGFIEYKDAMDARDVVPGKCLLVCRIIIMLDLLTRHLAFRMYNQLTHFTLPSSMPHTPLGSLITSPCRSGNALDC